MKLGNRVGGLRPWLGVFGVAAVALGISLQLEGAPVGVTRPSTSGPVSGVEAEDGTTNVARPVVASRPAGATSSQTSGRISVGAVPADGYRVVNIVHADYRDDRGTREREAGTLFGPLPYRNGGNVAACTLPACSFNIDCDDGNPCTDDRCNYDPIDLGNGLCQGNCLHDPVPNGDAGECDDALFCNGVRHCQGGACVAGTVPVCCTEPGETTECAEDFPRCNSAADNSGAQCRSNSDCVGGACDRCQPTCASAADCNDGKECNGVESCVSGKCLPGLNPCGSGADCTEGDCIVGVGGTPCNADADCPTNEGGICRLTEAARCFTGRCCTPDDGSDPDDQMQCSDNRGLSLTIGGQAGCSTIGSSLWYPGDTGRDDNTDLCGGEDASNQAEDEWGCPKYSRGIMQNVAATPPLHRDPIVGPFSDSPASVASPRGPNAAFHAMGDDYAFANVGPETHLSLDAVRWVGGIVAGNRVSMEFYDNSVPPVFIEDIVLPPLGAAIGVQVVVFTPPLTIPPAGYINLRVASDFEPDTEIVWFSTNNSNGVGTNDANKILVNGAIATGGANFLGNGNGIMAFELVGDKIVTPTGACCDRTTGECADGVLSWICKGVNNDIFHGTGTLCASCNGGNNPGLACRRCAGGANNGLACSSDTNCPGGSCDPLNSLCTGLTCTAGTVGASCTVNANCNVAGVCQLGFCVAGTVGAPCANNAACNIAGVCGNATCQNNQDCAVGACCNPTTGVCTETTSGGCVGTFQGFGTSCDADRGYDAGAQNCCLQPSAQRCMGGPNNDTPCTLDSQCGRCVAGANAGLACSSDAGCPGSICDGKCLVRRTGADDCEDARLIAITVPAQNEPAKVITISGNNSGATNTATHPDTCFDPNEDPENDPGWWERFSVDKCARVRIDMCCSDPVHQPQWAFLQSDCGSGCATAVGNAPDPYIIGQQPNARGAPYCPEDNLWQTFGLLGAGTYAHPIFSQLAGAHGNYQLHITVEACPASACCYLACSISGTPCGSGAPCGGGQGTCNAQCDELDQIACDAKFGFYLGPPQVGTAVPLCGGADEACLGGSCCTGPGVCEDTRENSGNPMTKAECDSRSGSYVGGVLCKGGRCAGNGACVNYSCATSEDCCQPGSNCTGSAQDKAQANPCPICEVEGPNNCQALEGQGGGLAVASDRSLGTGQVAADDFIHGGGNITTVCVWGGYLDLNPETTGFDCGAVINSDLFRVRVYADNNGIPGTMLAERNVTLSGAGRPRAEIPNALHFDAIGGTATPPKVYGYQLTLPTPITGLSTSTCYWLEVSNDTPDTTTPVLCTWHWIRLDDDDASGNNYSVVGDQASGYVRGSESEWDMAFCLNTNFIDGGCATHNTKACCACGPQNVPPDPRCSETSLKTCGVDDGTFIVNQNGCTGFSCPPVPGNDLCNNASPVAVGTYAFNTGCALTDGFGPIVTDFGTDQIENDLWFEFTVPDNPAIANETEECDLLVSMCGTGATADNSNGFDSMLAIYRDAANFGTCPCPTTAPISNATLIVARDENCFKSAVGGPSFVEARGAKPGECYTIRLGGFPGPDQKGTGVINIACGAPFCGNDHRDGSPIEVCDGRDVPAGFACSADCLSLIAVACGDAVITGNEECDPACTTCDDNPGQLTNGCYSGSTCTPAGPTACTCTPFCGNAHIEAGEECDQTDDDACPGQCTGGCACPIAACGNNIVDAGEECDGTSNPCDTGNCRPPGDILGGCTCACEVQGTPPMPIIWNADPLSAVRANRSITFSALAATASGGDPSNAIQVRMIDLQNPVPPNAPCCPPLNFGTYESATCTAPGETGGCNRWVGPVQTFLEFSLNPLFGNYRGARLQCTPYYYNWASEPSIVVVGAELVPSSTYEMRSFGSACKGSEVGCPAVLSPAVTVNTRRWGDVAANFNPPSATAQPDALDVTSAVNKFTNKPGAPTKRVAQIQGQTADPNFDIDALDITSVVDGFRGLRFPFAGPCSCPSSVTCNATPCTSGGQCPGGSCVKTCVGGVNTGLVCKDNASCPGSTCGSGFCRDRCQRCN